MVMIPRRGAYVADVSIHDINEVYEIRTALETLAAGLAAERIEDSEIEEMDKYLIATRTYVSRLDYAKIVEMDTAFHDVIYKASRNKRCMNIISTLRQQITSIRERSMPYPAVLTKCFGTSSHCGCHCPAGRGKSPDGRQDPYGKCGTNLAPRH